MNSARFKYVVLWHDGIPDPHFDLMVDAAPAEAGLATWRCEAWPVSVPAEAARIGDHRREYLTYEGEISGGRGKVKRVERGECGVTIAAGRWEIAFEGGKGIVLRHLEGERWLIAPNGGV